MPRFEGLAVESGGEDIAKAVNLGAEVGVVGAKPPRFAGAPVETPKPRFAGTAIEESKPAAKESEGFFTEFGKALKSPWELWTQESIPALITKGVRRIAEDPGKAREDLSQLKVPESAAIVQGSTQMLKDLASFAYANPGALTAETVNALVADPYLIFAPNFLGARLAGLGAKLGAKAGPAAAEFGPAIGRYSGAIFGGAGVAGLQEGARQFSTGNYDSEAIANAMNLGAGLGLVSEVGVRLLKRKPTPGAQPVAAFDSDAAARAQLGLFERTPGATEAAPPAPGTTRYYARSAGTKRATLTPDQADIKKAPEAARFVDLTPNEVAALKPTSRANVKYTTDSQIISALKPLREIKDTLSPGMIQGTFGAGIELWRTALRRGVKAGALGAAVGAAISIGLNDNSPEKQLAYGATVGGLFFLARMLPKPLSGDAAPLLNAMNGAQNEMAFNVSRWADAARQLVPDAARREAITAAIENPSLARNLSADEKLVARSIEKFNQTIGKTAQKEGIMDGFLDNYISHLVESDTGWRPRPDEFRKYKTFVDLERALANTGMRVRTKDAVEITNIYANSMFRTLMRHRAGQAIKEYKLPNGDSLVRDVPNPDFKMVDYGPLNGKAIHYDLLPAYENAFRVAKGFGHDVGVPIAIALKRAAVFGSLFHAMSLKQGFMGTMGFKKGIISSKGIVESARKAFVGNDPNALELLRQGLILSREYDVDPAKLNTAMSRITRWVDSKVPGVGATSKYEAFARFGEAMDQFTFGWLQNGYKMAASLHLMEQAMNPTARGFLAKRLFGNRVLTREQAARAAASFANDNFGSLDWFRMASESQSAFMRNLAYKLTSQPGRGLMQIMMFAPDWTFATFRAAYKSMPGATDVPGLAAMHRLYTIKAAMLYFTFANAVNYMFTGHSILENKNIMRADLGNGREMQLSKHFVEPFEWLLHPTKTALNKMGAVVKLPMSYLQNVEYMSAYGAAPPIVRPSMNSWEGVLAYAMWLMKTFMPIAGQQSGGVLTGASSWFGFPVYGKDTAEKQELAVQRAIDRAAQREKRAELQGTPWRVKAIEDFLERFR